MATRVIDDTKLNDIAVAIQAKDNGGQMTVDQMPVRIGALPSPTPVVSNPALILRDWEGTKLGEYSTEDALALTELPAPSTLHAYATADHELLLFQAWNWSLADIKTWVQNHEGECLDVGAIYTTTDGQDHNYWNNPRLEGTSTAISMQKRATTSIEEGVFSYCYSLTSINIPSSVTSIEESAFCDCYSLTSINIPSSVTSIEEGAFSYCYSLTSINIPSSVTSIEDGVFSYCYSLTSINIPSSVTSIGSYVFFECYSLTSINIPSSVTSIGSYAFCECYSLTSINIPSSVTSIGSYVFSYCYSLTSINIPSSVTSIEESAFCDCHTLIDTIIRGTPSLSSTIAFSETASELKFYVPRANLSWFETATNWSTYYAQNRFVAIEDYIEYLESIGYNVDEYKEAA